MAKSAIKLIATVLLIGIMIYLSIYGITIGNMKLQPVSESIRKGLDIAGGTIVIFEADAANVTKDQADTVVEILRARLTDQGYTEANVTNSGKRFQVEIPAVSDPDEAIALMGQTAKLSFVDEDGTEIMTGQDIENAVAEYTQIEANKAKEYIVTLTLKPEGVAKFAEATDRVSKLEGEGKNFISIKLDEQVISRPSVSEKIDNDSCYIRGSFNTETAKELASLIRAGQLPFNIKEVSLSSVGATLGESAFTRSLLAAFISILLVMIYMTIFYRLPGVIASIALAFYTVLTVFIFGIFRINLNLPGIAGTILSIGMAVDANVVIFERIIDELKNGKTLRAAIDAGFHRAMSAVMDSNITTLISAAILWWLGSGTVKGFGITLFIGTIISMFTAISVTKFMINQLVGMNIKNRRLYGIGVK